MEYKGKLHETAVKFEDTDIWMDSCGEEELNYALDRGVVCATSNPLIVGNVIKKELPRWEPTIKSLITQFCDASEDDITWELIYIIGEERAKKFLPIYEKTNGKKGRLSVQTNPKLYRSAEKMLEQAERINSLGKNMQVKFPASAAGIKAIEEATYRGISVNATVSFTVAQAVAVAEAVERSLKRRKSEGLPTETMAPVCTLMIGRTDDWMKQYTAKEGILLNPECYEWAGVAVIKETYRIYKERGYTTRLLSAAYRNHYHWSELIGGDLAMTIPFDWHKKINACDVEAKIRIDNPVKPEYLCELKKLDEFQKSYNEKGLEIKKFEYYGGFRATISGFIEGYNDLVKIISGYMIT